MPTKGNTSLPNAANGADFFTDDQKPVNKLIDAYVLEMDDIQVYEP